MASFGVGNGFLHIQHQTIAWTNSDVLLIRPILWLNFSEIWVNWCLPQKCIWKWCLQHDGHFVQSLTDQMGSKNNVGRFITRVDWYFLIEFDERIFFNQSPNPIPRSRTAIHQRCTCIGSVWWHSILSVTGRAINCCAPWIVFYRLTTTVNWSKMILFVDIMSFSGFRTGTVCHIFWSNRH